MDLLMGFGGDEDSVAALSALLERVAATGDALTVAVFAAAGVDRPLDDIEAEVRTSVEDAGVDADVRRLPDDPGGRLVALAEAEDYDRIVLGGGTRSPLGKITFDDVTEFVLLNADTSVTLLR